MKYVKGNLLDAPTQALVNTVNTVGVMGKGIALQFKQAFPYNHKKYLEACKAKTLVPGKLLLVQEQSLAGEKIIVNFPTKTDWRLKSEYDYIESGLRALVLAIKEHNIKSIAIPPLGCGNGGLDWDKVKSLIEEYLGEITTSDVIIYEPNDGIKQFLKEKSNPHEIKLTPARAMLLYALFHYENEGELCNMFVANKLAYFLQRLGEPTLSKLKFTASHFGPFAPQVEHLLHAVNGKFIKGLEQKNVKAFETLDLQYAAWPQVRDYIKTALTVEQSRRIEALIELTQGFQSALSLEILATVDFIQKDQPNIELNGIVASISAWSSRKQHLFRDEYISIAHQHLQKYAASFVNLPS
jgi:O-acetyl-ADP-ribose deacetylase (regulator of RNase III)